jgi:type I restriction enzyme R subunit
VVRKSLGSKELCRFDPGRPQRRVVNWAQRDDIQNEMRNDLDDYLFDVMRGGKGHPLTPDSTDEIINRILSIARTRMPD